MSQTQKEKLGFFERRQQLKTGVAPEPEPEPLNMFEYRAQKKAASQQEQPTSFTGPSEQVVPQQKTMSKADYVEALQRNRAEFLRHQPASFAGPAEQRLPNEPSSFAGPSNQALPSEPASFAGPSEAAVNSSSLEVMPNDDYLFWESIGYPQFYNRYAPFEIPAGRTLLSLKETEEGLMVSFTPTKQELYDTFSEGKAKADSIKFYKSIGFSQFGGKYAPFTIPEGAKVTGITEKDGGLTVDYEMPGQVIDPFAGMSAEELEFYRIASGAGSLPGRSSFGAPSGFGTLPVNYEEAMAKAAATPVKQSLTVGPSNAYWTDPLGKGSTVTLLKSLKASGTLPANTKVTGFKDVTLGAMPGEPGTPLEGVQPFSTVRVLELEVAPTTKTPSGLDLIAASNDPILSTFAENVQGAQEMSKDPVGYTTKKVLEIGSLTAALVAPPVAVLGAGLSVTTAQVMKSTGVQISLDKGVSFGEPGGLLTPEEAVIAAESGALFSVAASGLAGISGKIVSTVSNPVVRSTANLAAKTTVNAGLGAGVGYLASGGDVDSAILGGVIGGGATLAAAGAGYVYSQTLKPYATVAAARIQAAGQRYLTRHYLETGELTVLDKALAKILHLETPSNKYIQQEQTAGKGPSESWGLTREESTISKALVPKNDSFSAGKSGSSSLWAKSTQWEKPSGIKSSLNQYIGSGQVVSLKSLTSVQKQLIKPASAFAAPAVSQAATAGLLTQTMVKTATTPKKESVLSVVPALGVVWDAPTTQVLNPFTQFQGQPFYKASTRKTEDYENLFLSTPKSGLPAPAQLPKTIQQPSLLPKETPIEKATLLPITTPVIKPIEQLKPTPIQNPVKTPALNPINIPSNQPIIIPGLVPVNTPKIEPINPLKPVPVVTPVNVPLWEPINVQVPKEVVGPLTGEVQAAGLNQVLSQQSLRTPRLLSEDDWFKRKKHVDPFFIGNVGRYKRKYPLMTSEQMLKEFLAKPKRKRRGR